ncbi:E3 ubiquitin-protein ligase listerin [Anabrus simplex]|uniref:E3 ubiquitin-protein ligase listerin n=1 Tax=Anabrus simplex TaxID=316456 RepID=UPI0035A37BBB
MGGKHKQAQRTKDNAKPSSSGRSAALLANATSPVPNFAAVKDCGYVPIFPCLPTAPTEEFDAGIDSNFQLVLKKMNKKDSTTRLKALQEFASLVGSSELDAVKAVLPFWPRLYCLLAGDIEHRVREAAQEAHRTIVVRTKRNMAPFLRQVAGPWFTAQFDTYPPVGTAATRAFQDAFPANKLVEALIFCRDEILKFISDSLLGQVSQSTNSAKNVSADKLKARQQRIVVSCLQAFAHFLRLMPGEQLSTVAALPIVENLVDSKRFWELASDKLPAVRSAWMCVLTAVLERTPQLMEKWHAQVIGAVLTRLNDSEPSVLPYVWEAALHVLSTIQDWESHGNLDKQVLPPLWQILKEAGHGTAASIFPNLLPVLSCLLKTCKTPADRDTLCDQFFASLREGFTKKSVVQSRAESEAVAQCYIECVRYVSSSDECSPQQLVENHLLPAVELTFNNDELTLLSKALYEHISSLTQYWSRNRTNSSYASMLQYFWQGLANVYTRSVKISVNNTTSQQVELCLCLKSSGKHRKKVHFGEKGDDGKKLLQTPSEESPSEDFKTELQNLVHQICSLYITELKETKRSCFIVPLSKLVTSFNSPEMFNILNPGHDLSDMLNFIQQSWPSYGDANKKSALEMVLCWVHHLRPEEKVPLLWKLSEDEDMLLWTVHVSKAQSFQPDVCEWLKSTRMKDHLLSLTRQLSAPVAEYAKKVLTECVSSTEDGDLLVGGETVSAILDELCSMLSQDTSLAEFVAELGLAVCLSFQCADIKDSLRRLVTTLFDICCDPSSKGRSKSSKMPSAWQEGLNALVGMEDEGLVVPLLRHFCSTAKKHLSVNEVLSPRVVRHLVNVSCDAIMTMAADDTTTSSLTMIFLMGLDPEFSDWENQLMALCLDSEKLAGATGLEPLPAVQQQQHYPSVELIQYINFSLFSLQLIAQAVFTIDEEDDDLTSKFNQANFNPDGKIIKSKLEEVVDPTENANEDEGCSKSVEDASEPQTATDKPEDSSAPAETTRPSDTSGDVLQSGSEPEEEEVVCEVLDDDDDLMAEEQDTRAPKAETVMHMQDSLLHAVRCVAICKVFRRHYQSTKHYSKIFPHISTIQKQCEEIIALLQSSGVDSVLVDSATEMAKDYGGLWVWVRYLLSGPSRLSVAYAALKDSDRCDYGAQVLASFTETTLSPSQLDDRPHLTTLATWLRHLKGSPTDVLGGLIVGSLEAWPQLNNDQLLRECDVSSRESSEVEKVTEMIHTVAACITECPHLLTAHLWDFILVSTPYYVLSLTNNQPNLFPDALLATSLQPVHNLAVFTIAVCNLYSSLARHIHRVVQEQDAAFLEHAREWNDVFSGDVHQAFLALFVRTSNFMRKNKPSLIGHRLLQSLSSALVDLDPDHMTSKSEMVKEPVTHQEVIKAACHLIHSPVQPLQVAAYHLLKKSLPLLVDADASFASSLEVDDAGEIDVKASDFKMHPLLNQMMQTKVVVDIMLADFTFGDSCLVEPHTDSHYYTAAYLLLWDLLLDACGLAGSELRYHYASIFRDSGLLHSLLHHLFFLMPEEVLETTSCKSMAHLFQAAPPMMAGDSCTGHELQHWACWVFHCALRRLPAVVRQWWGDTKPKVNTVVQRVTYHYVSPLLCQNELSAIQTNNTKLKNMEIKVHMRAREVVATYAVDETRMELVITLPDVYPLGMVQVNSNAPLVGTNQWRNWVRHLSIFLTHQNGSVWDGLLLWKSNLDKRFEGVEECYICFSILHGTNFQIPKLCCKTCKKKFHSPCLYKWFSTSNKSTCPICRNMF